MLARWSSLLTDLKEVEQAELPPSLRALCVGMLMQAGSVHASLRTELGRPSTDLSDVATFLETIGNAYLDMSGIINARRSECRRDEIRDRRDHACRGF